jgi:hypothetical protein
VIIVTKIDRFARSTLDLLAMLKDLEARGHCAIAGRWPGHNRPTCHGGQRNRAGLAAKRRLRNLGYVRYFGVGAPPPRDRRKTHQRPILSHGEGCRPSPRSGGPFVLQPSLLQCRLDPPTPLPPPSKTGPPSIPVRHDPLAVRIKSRPRTAGPGPMAKTPPMSRRRITPAKPPRSLCEPCTT